MELLMCGSCGTFVQAVPGDESLEPVREDCPDCGGTEFLDNDSGRRVVTG